MDDPFPPANFIPTHSAVDGIEVYMPAPPLREAHQEIVDFKCPRCGAMTAYSVRDEGVTCAHCGHYEPPDGYVVGRAAEEFEFKLETMKRVARGWGHARKEIECRNCGVVTSIPPEELAYSCPFCGSNRVIQREAPQEQLRPRFIIPFEVEPQACQRIAKVWLGSSWMTPGSLRRLAQFGSFSPIYLPFWTFDADTEADWRAEVAHSKTERYFSNGKWKTRTVTVWKWESGRAGVSIDDLVVKGSSHMSPVLLERISRYDLGSLVSYEPGYLAGMQAQAYAVSLEEAWTEGRKVMREMTRQTCRSQASGPSIRNFSMVMDFHNETWRYILLPAYVAAYRFQGNDFQVIVNGQTGEIAGQLPVSWLKVGLVSAAALSPGLLLCIAGAVTVAFAGIGMVIGAIGTILLILGAGMMIKWIQDAMRMDDA